MISLHLPLLSILTFLPTLGALILFALPARQARWTTGNAEVAGWTDLVGRSRHDARRQLEGDVRRLGAEGVVIAAMRMRVRVRDCPAAVGRYDHIAEATLIGTAITRFARAERRAEGPALAIMSLDPQRRQAARISSGNVFSSDH